MGYISPSNKGKVNEIGAINEMKATVWLMEQGYHVFLNVMGTGPADLIAWCPKTDKTLKIDVKTARRYQKQDGTIDYKTSLGNEKNKKSHVTYLGVCNEDNTFHWI
jgi:Holliday junction resolvase-like predicted endonuclease